MIVPILKVRSKSIYLRHIVITLSTLLMTIVENDEDQIDEI